MIKYAVAGIPVDDESLAVEDIAKVGAFGDFLSLDATLRHMRELSQPVILDRRVREDWEARGAHGPRAAVARARALELIESHQPLPLDPDVAEADPRHRRGRRSRERRGMKDQLKQAIIDGNADTALASPRRCIASGRPGPRDPRRGPAARHGGRRRAHARGRDLHPRGAAVRPRHAGLPRPAAPAPGGRRGPASAPSCSAPSRATCTTSARTSSA